MRKSSLEKTFSSFYTWMEWDVRFLIKVYDTKRVISARDEKEQIFEAFVFKICANWEVLTEDLILDCLNKDTTQFAHHTGFSVPKHLSRDVCKAMIVGVGYLDFKSISELKGLAKKILVPENNPFKEMTKAPTEKIDEFYTIRNYLAHYSYAAERKLKGVYEKHKMRQFREPGGYLLAVDQQNQMPRVGVYIDAFVEAADEMAHFLGI